MSTMSDEVEAYLALSPYDKLIVERTAFQQAGLKAKVEEWDYKIRKLEIAQKYEPIDFKHIAEQFGIKGMNEALAVRKRELKEQVEEIIGPKLLKSKRISETAMYDFIDRNAFRYDKNPEMTEHIMKILCPKLTGTAQKLFATMFKVKDMENAGEKKIAFIRVEKVEDYMQNDNPPIEELLKVVHANVSNLFHTLYIAFPMIDYEKQVDPIIFGTLQDPNKSYNQLSSNMRMNEVTIDMLDWLNLGDMFKIAEWI